MQVWEKRRIQTISGEEVQAVCPVIISASRATDIPAYYSDWFIARLKKGYTKWQNPFNRKFQYISFQKARLIVFWSKNPQPLINKLNQIETITSKPLHYYFQFTLNNYEQEQFEPNIPPLSQRLTTFKKLAEKIGSEKVIWRYDPLLLSKNIAVDTLIEKIKRIGDEIHNHTNKLVFSFARIEEYRKVKNRMLKNKIPYIAWNRKHKYEFANKLQQLNKQWKLQLATCAEPEDFSVYGITHNKCIDNHLIEKLFPEDAELMNFLGINQKTLFGENAPTKSLKDKGQRKNCACIYSKDIGKYNTCPNLCVYCYANTSDSTVMQNYKSNAIF